jgi:hypothetical protein
MIRIREALCHAELRQILQVRFPFAGRRTLSGSPGESSHEHIHRIVGEKAVVRALVRLQAAASIQECSLLLDSG